MTSRPSVPTRPLMVVGLALMLAALAGCSAGATPTAIPTAVPTPAPTSAGPSDCPTSQPDPLAAGETRTVAMDTELGAIELRIEADLSPIAAGNFVALVQCGYFDGIVFHRVVPDFVIQGGDGEYGRDGALDVNLIGTGGPGYRIQDEPVISTYSRGTVAMARSAQPNSVGSQFFIVLSDDARSALARPEYNNYQIIGSVTAGLDVVDAIAAAADQEIPTDPVAMTRVSVSNRQP